MGLYGEEHFMQNAVVAISVVYVCAENWESLT